MATPNLMQTGIYTASEAAALIGETERKVRGWVAGYGGADPIVENELGWVDGRLAFSFTNLMEVRFIKFFVDAGVHLFHIRRIMEEAKKLLNRKHPFATNVVFLTDGRKIMARIGEKHGGRSLLDLRSKNFEMPSVVFDSLRHDVEFNPDGVATSWRPRPEIAPHVVVHPKFSFGQPILLPSRIPTKALARAVEAEKSATTVADWYEIPVAHVREAVRFEKTIH